MCVTYLPVCAQMFVCMQVSMHMEEESAGSEGYCSLGALGMFQYDCEMVSLTVMWYSLVRPASGPQGSVCFWLLSAVIRSKLSCLAFYVCPGDPAQASSSCLSYKQFFRWLNHLASLG